MKKFLIALGLACTLVFGVFADEVADADVEAQNEAIAAEQEAAQNGETTAEAEAEENENAEAEAVAAAEAPAEEPTEIAEPTEEPAADGEDIAAAEETPAEETPADEPAADGSDTLTAETETVAEETADNGEEEVEPITITEDNPDEPYDDNTASAGIISAANDDLATPTASIADTAVNAAAGVAEEELKALIASFPKGTWIDSKYNAAWVFDENGMLTVQNAKTGKIYFTFSLNKINSYSVVPTADGIAISFVCGETKRQYTFTKPNDDDYNMTLQIQAKWLKNGYTAQMSKKQNIGVGKN